jgi:hypothetical protein
LHKNLNSFHRIEGVPSQHAIHGAKQAAVSTKVDLAAWAKAEAANFPSVPAH